MEINASLNKTINQFCPSTKPCSIIHRTNQNNNNNLKFTHHLFAGDSINGLKADKHEEQKHIEYIVWSGLAKIIEAFF